MFGITGPISRTERFGNAVGKILQVEKLFVAGVEVTPGGSGSVTSVGLSLPASIFTVSGSPVIASGTLTGTLATQAANRVWAGPTTGADAAPTFRALVAADLPTHVHAAGDITSGTIATARLGSGTANSSTFLRGDQTWVSVSAAPGGSTTQVQFNNAGAFGGDSNFVWNNTEKQLSVSSASTTLYAVSITKSGNVNQGALTVTSSSTVASHTTLNVNNSGAGYGAIVANSSGSVPALRVLSNANKTASGGIELGCLAGTAGTNQDAIYMYGSVGSGAGTNNTSVGIKFSLESSTTLEQDAGRILCGWHDATNASRSSYIVFQTVYQAGALAERLRISNDGYLTLTTTTPTIVSSPVRNVVLIANSASTPNDGFGAGIAFSAESSNTNNRVLGYLDLIWETISDATRTSIAELWLVDSGSETKCFKFGKNYIDMVYGSTAQLRINGTKVVGSRETGWTAATGTALKTAWATYTAGTASGSYTSSELQTVMNELQSATQRIKALEDSLRTHGLIN